MALLLGPDCREEGIFNGTIVGRDDLRGAEVRHEVELLQAEEAGTDLGVGGDAKARALAAEWAGDGGDQADAGRAGIAAPGAHGFSEVLYAFSSAGNNNGSAFAGLSANTPFYNLTLGLAMWLGRFGVVVPVLAMAGSLAAKKRLTAGEGTLPTHGPLFVALLIGIVLLVGLLNYVPALALGPVVEHLILWGTH